MTILTPIENYSLLANLDRIEVHHLPVEGGSRFVGLNIWNLNTKTPEVIFSGAIFLNATGNGTITDVAGLLEPYIYQKLVGKFRFEFTYEKSVVNVESVVVFSKTRIDVGADSFLTNYFLTLQQSTLSILPTQLQYVHFYAIEECTIKAVLKYSSGEEVKELDVISAEGVGKIQTLDVSPSKFEKAGDKLISYTIVAGARNANYTIDWITPDRGLTFAFSNSFGVQEVFYTKGEHTLDINIDRSSGIFQGLNENFDIKEVHKHKLFTGLMPKSLSFFAVDFIRSMEIYLLRTGQKNKPICITDSKIVNSSSDADFRNYEIEFQPSQVNHNVLELAEAGRIFDNTFDNTFN